ncbi:protein of unknown function [Moritella yayanosii]|uniref:Uncharacterized protein n=1 Tax=Moritella yayanosii TaxID=69539 RepID=A0A330LYJ5_9GAMM|nr:protein of unknown function [Moritella yayanosii]
MRYIYAFRATLPAIDQPLRKACFNLGSSYSLMFRLSCYIAKPLSFLLKTPVNALYLQ